VVAFTFAFSFMVTALAAHLLKLTMRRVGVKRLCSGDCRGGESGCCLEVGNGGRGTTAKMLVSAREVAILHQLRIVPLIDIVKIRHSFLCNREQHDVTFFIDHPDQRSGTFGLTVSETSSETITSSYR